MVTSVDIQNLCKLIHKSFSVPIHFLSKDKDILFEFTSTDMCNPFYSQKEEQLSELYENDDPNNFPIIKTNRFLEKYILIHIEDNEYVTGTLAIGPFICQKISKDTVITFKREVDKKIENQDGIAYFDSIPVVQKLTLIHISILFYYLIFNKKLDAITVWEQNKLLEETPDVTVNPSLYISSRRKNNSSYYDIMLEKQLFTAVKEGNKKKLIEYAYSFPQEKAGILSTTSQLRNQKNKGIIAITLASRYAIEGNLPSEVAFSLSDLYIQTLEQLNDLYAVNRLIEDALCTFADRVKDYNAQRYSNNINACIDYISKNIYNEFTLIDLANHIKVKPSYLSDLFKKEIGISLSHYIQRERIEEAKKLLTLTTYSLSEIYTWLNFSDQSYFIRIFKKFTDVTPGQYRQKYTVL
ncbi:helix-turn-helix domain-containing protein [Bacillus paramycoides]|uniref:helix-turn-helix domain-containing protein n=1 Tax=Bacillus paramycoides TaxID=2026194 RepID=UPI002E242AE4|nr:helix-turn-helix domain-containing protein [Bacillus paramycoides]MED0971549.1 helix-turn-helix domain-containing protein [Bacillus paramycoides]